MWEVVSVTAFCAHEQRESTSPADVDYPNVIEARLRQEFEPLRGVGQVTVGGAAVEGPSDSRRGAELSEHHPAAGSQHPCQLGEALLPILPMMG